MSTMPGGIKISFISQLQEKINARDNTVLVFEGKGVEYRVGITYSSNKYNIIISYNDFDKWGQLVPGERLPLVKKTTKEDTILYISTVMKRLGVSESGDLGFLGSEDDFTNNGSFDIKDCQEKEIESGKRNVGDGKVAVLISNSGKYLTTLGANVTIEDIKSEIKSLEFECICKWVTREEYNRLFRLSHIYNDMTQKEKNERMSDQFWNSLFE